MKFSTRQDIEAPIEYVFERATDFANFERQAMRRGIEVGRPDNLSETGVGMKWDAVFQFRNKSRAIHVEVVEYNEPENVLLKSESGGVMADLSVEFLPLSKGRTRVRVGLELSPKTISARLLIQSLKFAKNNLGKRFEKRVRKFGLETEECFRKEKRALV